MNTSVGRPVVSAVVVLCMLIASVAMLFSAFALGGTIYQAPVAYVDGNETMANLGKSVALVDLNGDKIGDLVVGVPFAPAYGLKDAGAVRVYLSAGGVALANLIVINGTNAEDLFGWCVANVSDVNGDGRPDLAVGAPLADPGGHVDAGNVSIFYGWPGFSGTANITINSDVAGERFGFSIAPAGDIMVDGMDDMIVGAPSYDSPTITGVGRVEIFYGGSPMNSIPDKTFVGDTAGGHFGWAVAGGVNVDQDSTLDMVVGAPDKGAAGSAYIYRNLDRANPTENEVTGKTAGDCFGSSVALMDDLNLDTFGEIAIGAPYNNDNGSDSGSVSIILGGSKFNAGIDITLVGSPNEWFGYSVASGGIRQDGYSDLLVGAPMSRLNATSVGRAYAYYGGSAWTTPNLTLVPDSDARFFGGCVAIGDNLTGDPAPDFAVGDPLFILPGLPNAGRVYVYAGVRLVIPQSPIVKGHVYVPGTTVGLQGFTVTLESPSFNKSATTNAAGYYQMTAVPGTYWLNASRAGYVVNSTTIVLAMDDVKTVDFYPLKVPVVTGVVRDSVSMNVIQGASVALYSGTTLIATATTPANGTYWIPVPTAYIPPEGSSAALTLKAWDQTHYMSSTDFTVARNETKWVNSTLDRFPVVTGNVRDALDLSAVRGTVTANQGATVVATTTTDIRGFYTLVAVNASAPARLYVNVSATGHFKTMDWVDVEKNGTDTLNFLLQRDNTKPTSQLEALAQYTTTAAVALSATATDANGIKEVQLWYRKAGSGSYIKYGADTGSPYDFNFDTTTTGGDGIYEFYSIAVDWADNAEDAPGTNDTWTNVDSHAPTLAITSPSDGQLLATSTVAVAWTGSDPGSGLAKFEVQLDSYGWVDKGLATAHSFTSVPDGSHQVSVRATDAAGLTNTKSVGVVVDTASAVSLVSPLPTYTTSVELALTATAADANGILEVQLWWRYGGSGAFAYFGADTSSPYTFLLNTSMIDGDGMYEYYSLAIDGAGNNETAPSGNDTGTIVDNAAPILTMAGPTAGQTVGTADVLVNWTGSDSASGIASFMTRVDGGSWVDRGTSLSATLTSLADGNHTVEVNATDRAGHSKLASVTFRVDTVMPVVLIMAPINNSALASASITLHWSASDVGSGIMTLQVSSDGSAWESVDVNSTEYVFYGPSGFPEGDYTLYVRAADHGGLTTTATVRTVLDRTDPTVTITSPRSDQKVKHSNVTVGWAMLDTGSGVSQVRISIDGGAFMSLGSATSYDIATLADGKHNVTVRVTDRAGNYAEATVEFTISTGGGISSIMMGAIALVIIVAIVAGVLLMKRKKGPVPEKKEPGK